MLALPFTFHSFNGIRHLVWDMNKGEWLGRGGGGFFPISWEGSFGIEADFLPFHFFFSAGSSHSF